MHVAPSITCFGNLGGKTDLTCGTGYKVILHFLVEFHVMNNKYSSKMFRSSKVNCCVVGCGNSYYNTNTEIKFYSFPNRSYESERRQIWINRIRRVSNENSKKVWEPTRHSRICSIHFIGNEKSNNPKNTAYNPSIFPDVYRNSSSTRSQSKENRLRRYMNRSILEIEVVNSLEDGSVSSEVKEIACQTDIFENDINNFIFECVHVNHMEISTQANIPKSNSFKETKNKCVGNTDTISCDGFHGISSVKSDKSLNSLCGTTFNIFTLLLSMLTLEHGNNKLALQNNLLLFLIKLKHGLSMRALGVLFNVHYTTASRIFTKILYELRGKTENYIYWPNRAVIDKTMPKVFKLHYPNCRAIIDCSEISIEQPNKIDDRIYTYSNYKGMFTAKFLVAVAPNGFISFISECYGGRSSDAYITNDCGFLHKLEKDDLVLADKGFPGIKCTENAIIVVPPFVHDGMLTVEEVERTYTIASLRIHVERAIQRIKIYNILQKIPANLFPHIDSILRVCCVLANLQAPIIASDETS